MEHWPLAQLIPYAGNARTHDDSQVSQIAGSMAEFGFVNPILVGEDNIIVAGHGRLLAAQQLGLDTVPVIVLGHLSATQRKALLITDNKLSDNAGWNEELLKLELGEIERLGFDLNVLGFSDVELDELLNTDDGLIADDLIPDREDEVISQTGDCWHLGAHRVLCGDATSTDDMGLLMGADLADMVFTDPPYNVDYGHNAKDKMRGKERRIINDNLGDGFYSFLLAALGNLLKASKGACYICMSSSELDCLQKAFRTAGGKWSTFIIWAKNTFTLGRADYQRQYEPILYGWGQGGDHFWCGARDQGDVWFFNKPVKNDLHPTMKPVELVERAIKNSSKSRDIILDPFGGSGSTLIACEKTGRHARLMEIDANYVDVIIRRWQAYTGHQAVLAGTELDFECVAVERRLE